MMSPIGLYLAEFVPQSGAARGQVPAFPASDLLDREDGPAEDSEAVRLAAARGEGFAEGAATAQAAFAAEVAAREARNAGHLAAERQRWAETEGAVLADRLERGLVDLERKLAEALAEILEPFLNRALRAKAAVDLREAVGSLLANGADPAIRVSGPADMVEPLRVAFEGRAGVEVLASDSPEVTILAGDTLIRSQLRSWVSGLKLDPQEDR